ncbi:hypothetical protein AB0T83_19745 [Fluviibacterium sp. DFM31]|uniref:Uncharacterized protein n=1 Tax=Meridianimarinicoccus marinus TaxID=3231483 RepID=A0ABV3LBN7_9RHOB
MSATTYVCSITHVANPLNEDPELLEANVNNDDNLSCGNIVSVHIGTDDYITALTDEGIDELRDMLASARGSVDTCHSLLNNFAGDPDIIAGIKNQSPREKSGGYNHAHFHFR